MNQSDLLHSGFDETVQITIKVADQYGGSKVRELLHRFHKILSVCTIKYFSFKYFRINTSMGSQGYSGCLHFMYSRMSLLTVHLPFFPVSVS